MWKRPIHAALRKRIAWLEDRIAALEAELETALLCMEGNGAAFNAAKKRAELAEDDNARLREAIETALSAVRAYITPEDILKAALAAKEGE